MAYTHHMLHAQAKEVFLNRNPFMDFSPFPFEWKITMSEGSLHEMEGS